MKALWLQLFWIIWGIFSEVQEHDPESQQNKLEVNKWMTVRLRMCWLQKSELLVQSLSKMAPFSIIMLLLVIVNGFSAGH